MIIAYACFLTLTIFSIRSFLLMFEREKPLLMRMLDLIYALSFLAAAFSMHLFLRFTFVDDLLLVIALSLIISAPIILSISLRLRNPYRLRPFLLFPKIAITFVVLTISTLVLMTSGFMQLTSDEPIVKISMIGRSRPELVEWKLPDQTFSKETFDAYEVRFFTPDNEHLATKFVYGDQVAVKAKVIRFRPILNAIGIRNICRIEYIFNGYTSPERQNELPHKTQEIMPSGRYLAPIQNRFWTFWEDEYFQKQDPPWIKSATLESNFLPLVDTDGGAFRGSYFLTLNSGGLSAVPLP